MADITITVAEIGRTGQKTTAIKDTTGKYWSVWNDKINDFSAGHTYRVTDFTTYTSPQSGKVFYTIKTYQPIPQPINQAPLSPASGHRIDTSYLPPATSIAADDQQRRMDIFICGSINNWLSNPNTPSDMKMMDIIDRLHMFKSAWLAVFGPNPLPKRNDPISTTQRPVDDDMNDDVPF